jgi:hypothetical protein
MCRRAISKAAAVAPPVFRVDEGFYAVGSSRAGVGYLLEVNPDGDVYCPCTAATRGLPCYHSAALGLHLGTVPQSWIPAIDVPVAAAIDETWRRVYEDASIHDTFFADSENVADVRNILQDKSFYLEALRAPTHNIAVQWLDGAWWCWGCIYRAVAS